MKIIIVTVIILTFLCAPHNLSNAIKARIIDSYSIATYPSIKCLAKDNNLTEKRVGYMIEYEGYIDPIFSHMSWYIVEKYKDIIIDNGEEVLWTIMTNYREALEAN